MRARVCVTSIEPRVVLRCRIFCNFIDYVQLARDLSSSPFSTCLRVISFLSQDQINVEGSLLILLISRGPDSLKHSQ